MQIAQEILDKIRIEKEARAARVARVWRKELSHKDWLFDGSPIRGRVMLAKWENLDWDQAWIDLGPSVAGNLGPYWHVPLRETTIDGELYACGTTVHRLYPKLLQSKWAMLVLHACYEAQAKVR